MKMLVAKNRVLSTVAVVLILMSLIVPVALAAAPPSLVLPENPVTSTYLQYSIGDPLAPRFSG